MQDGKQLKSEDIDSMEQEIFQRVSNTSTKIALDQFHPRLVEKAQKKANGLNKHGVPIESIEVNTLENSPSRQPQVDRAQTSNQGFRKYTNFFKLNTTDHPSTQTNKESSRASHKPQ